MDTTQMRTNRQMDNEDVVYVYAMEYYSAT